DGGNTTLSQKGGGGGAYCKKTLTILSSDWGSTVPYAVGAGGMSGTGSSGDDSTVGNVTLNSGNININAGGGKGGGVVPSGVGGTASGGDTNTNGGNGTLSCGGDSPNGGLGTCTQVISNAPGGGAAPIIGQDTEGGANG